MWPRGLCVPERSNLGEGKHLDQLDGALVFYRSISKADGSHTNDVGQSIDARKKIDNANDVIERTSAVINKSSELLNMTREEINMTSEVMNTTSEEINQTGEAIDKTSKMITKVSKVIKNTSEVIKTTSKLIMTMKRSTRQTKSDWIALTSRLPTHLSAAICVRGSASASLISAEWSAPALVSLLAERLCEEGWWEVQLGRWRRKKGRITLRSEGGK